ncbi:MAG: Gfo/Idh/MocA family protein, partial [Shewanella sp.]
MKQALGAATAGLVTANIALNAYASPVAPKPQAGKSIIGLIAPKIDVVRVGFIGVGERGFSHAEQLFHLEDVELKATCDSHPVVQDRAVEHIVKQNRPNPAIYTGNNLSYRDLLSRDDIDIAIISTPREWHASMAIEAMGSGQHAFVEVPLALTVEECWQIVDTAERTQKNCMMMENVNYGREKLMVHSMVRHDATSPRPCRRHNLIQGTNGVFAGFPNRIAVENGGFGQSYHEWDMDM